jgi:hypothetical protein
MENKAVGRHQQSFQPIDVYGSRVQPNVRAKMIWHRSVFSDLPYAGDQHVAGQKCDHPQREQFRESTDRHSQEKPKVTDHAAN